MWQKCTHRGELSSLAFVNFSIPVPQLGFCLPLALGPLLFLAVILFLQCPEEAPSLSAKVLLLSLLCSSDLSHHQPQTPHRKGGRSSSVLTHGLGFCSRAPWVCTKPSSCFQQLQLESLASSPFSASVSLSANRILVPASQSCCETA